MSGDPGPESGQPRRVVISAASKPFLPRHVKLRHDEARGRWIILAPERVFTPNAIAVAVLRLCDGGQTVADLANALALSYNAPKEQIMADVIAMLQDLADKGVVKA
jgi:pyrroloquinoline quinone biosynthesis protein D